MVSPKQERLQISDFKLKFESYELYKPLDLTLPNLGHIRQAFIQQKDGIVHEEIGETKKQRRLGRFHVGKRVVSQLNKLLAMFRNIPQVFHDFVPIKNESKNISC